MIARSRGADWLYTYLRTFYRDESRPSGWNNLVFPNVGMPHVFWQLQGTQILKTEIEEHGGEKVEHRKLVLSAPGELSPMAYDKLARDLVNYLSYMGEPEQAEARPNRLFRFDFSVFPFCAQLVAEEGILERRALIHLGK